MNQRWTEGVGEFTSLLRQYVEIFEHKLVLVEDNTGARQPLATYEVTGGPLKTTVLIHQTQRSLEGGRPEYRVRGTTTLGSEIGGWLRGRESSANRFASLGCLATNQKGAEVCWQSLIDPMHTDPIALLAAAASVDAAQALIQSIQRSLNGPVGDEREGLSEWEQIDFEQMQYDYAHLSTGRLEQGKWSMFTQEGMVEVSASHDNPYYQGGLLSLCEIGKDRLRLGDERSFDLNDLNLAGCLMDDTPMFGGWCEDKDLLYFVSFIPNAVKQMIPDINNFVVQWAVRRLRTVHELIDILPLT